MSLKRLSIIVGTGSFLSKAIAMIRKITIAAYFGVSPAYDAFTYAYLIPNFFLIFVGGFNGPFHNAMVSTLTDKNKIETQKIFSNINTLIGTLLFFISFILFTFSDFFINTIAPGLSEEVKSISIMQLKVMSPIVFVSGLIGFSFGLLNSKGKFFITSVTSSISNILIILLLLFLIFKNSFNFEDYSSNYINGLNLAIFTLIGAITTFIIQLPFLKKKGYVHYKLNWELDPKVINKIIKLFIPASITSGMLLFNIMTDRFFVSGFVGASAAITYASALVQAPISIISNSLLVPSLPSFSNLYKERNYDLLVKKINKIIIYAAFIMMYLAVIFITSKSELVSLIYGRGMFDSNAVSLVANLFYLLAIGMPFYLIRDILLKVFIGFSDAKTPFLISLYGLFLNIILDWLVIGAPLPTRNLLAINFGPEGVVSATMLVNIVSSTHLIICLPNTVGSFPFKKLVFNFFKLLISFFVTYLSINLFNEIFDFNSNILGLSLHLLIISLTSFFVFFLSAIVLNIDEAKEILLIIRHKLLKICFK